MAIIKKCHFILLALLFFIFSACATKNSSHLFENKVGQITTVDDAIEIFGAPDAKMVQGDGLLRHSWIIHKAKVIDAHYEKRYYSSWGSMGSNYELVYVPAKESRAYCFFNIYTTDDAGIVNMTWEGNVCDYLLQRNLGGNRYNGLPQNK